MVELQLILLFIFAAFWSLLYEVYGRGIYSSIAAVSWWILAAFWFTVTADATLQRVLAYLPLAVGWVYLIRFIAGLLQELRSSRWGVE